MRDNSRYEVVESRPLSQEALSAGLLSDAIVRLGAGTNSTSHRLLHPVRLVQVRTTPSSPTLPTDVVHETYSNGMKRESYSDGTIKETLPDGTVKTYKQQ